MEMSKRGQLTIFVIVAVVIVGVILAIFAFPGIKDFLVPEKLDAQGILESCIEPEIKSNLELLGKRGGYLEPEGYIIYDNEKVKYLCYSSENYKPCVVQQPLLKQHVQNEMNRALSGKIAKCMGDLKADYEKKGFSTTLGKIEPVTTIAPGKVEVEVRAPFSATKGENSERFEKFSIKINSKMYELLLTAASIVEFEAVLGDSEITLYMRYYPDITIKKIKLGDESTIYVLGEVNTKESFVFASRSLVWPPGYGLT